MCACDEIGKVLSLSEVAEKSKLRKRKDYKVTKQILDTYLLEVTKLRSKMGPTPPVEYVYGTSYELFRKNCRDFSARWKEACEISSILRDIKTNKLIQRLPPRSQSIQKLLVYLGLVESLGVTLADMVLILLIAYGKEVHTEWPVKHATTVDELEDIVLAYKLKFLKSERLSIFEGFINKRLRNDIAHFKLKIECDGKIFRRTKKEKAIQIDNEINRFWRGVDTLTLVFEDIGFLKWFEVNSLG